MAKQLKRSILTQKPYIISFLSDYGFKVTFGDKNNTLFARKAIELIIGETQPIKTLTYLRNEFHGISIDARTGIYDVLCEDEHKRVFIIEMQVDNYENLLERLQFYAFQVFTTMAKKGKGGFKDMGVIHCICILKGAITDSVNCHQIITLKNEENDIVMDNIVFHLIELGKFSIAKTKISNIHTEKEELFYTMKYAHQFDPFKSKQPQFWEKEFFQVALHRLDTSKMSPMEVAAYENALMRVHTVANKQQQIVEEALNKGEIKGKIEGEIKGKIEGKIEGKTEGIKKMLLRGKLTIQEIAEDMDVTIEFVKEIQQSLTKPVKKTRTPRAKKKTAL
jgi:predicted transposase/invertase (TIGR01784 family)